MSFKKDTLLPQGEGIRNAVRWFSEQGDYSAATIEEAARRFDLSPGRRGLSFAAFSNQRRRRKK